MLGSLPPGAACRRSEETPRLERCNKEKGAPSHDSLYCCGNRVLSFVVSEKRTKRDHDQTWLGALSPLSITYEGLK